MYYTLVVKYTPLQALQNTPSPVSQMAFKDHRTLKNAVSSIMNLDLREFAQEIVLEQNLPRHIVTAAIVDSKLNVIVNLRILEEFENINIPKGIYLQIDKLNISVEDFERKADFPISSYTVHGPRKNYYLLRTKTDLEIKPASQKVIRQHKAKPDIGSGRNFKRKL